MRKRKCTKLYIIVMSELYNLPDLLLPNSKKLESNVCDDGLMVTTVTFWLLAVCVVILMILLRVTVVAMIKLVWTEDDGLMVVVLMVTVMGW